MDTLITFTALLDLTAMSAALWMAFYVLARGPRSAVTQRAFLVLVFIALFFFGAYNNVFEQLPGSAAWRAVFLIAALYSWYDLTRKLLPLPDRVRTRFLRWFSLALGLATAVVLLTVPNAFIGEEGNALDIGRMEIELPFLLYGLYMIEISIALLINHNLTRKAGLARRYRFFFTATLLAIVNVGHGILSLAILPPQSRVIQDGLIAASIIVLGYSVARHQTFVERRTTFRDFRISAVSVMSLAALFGLVGLLLDFSPREIGVLVGLAVFSLSGYDVIRIGLDRVLNKEVARMREQLWGIARGSSSEELAPAAFRQSLAALCRSIEAGSGLLALRDGDGYRVHASQHSLPEGEILQLDGEIEGDLMEEGGHLAPSLHWIAPCTWKDETLGLVAVGVRQPGGAYNEEDLDLLTEFADQVALLVHLESLKTEQRARLEKLAGEYQRDQVHLQTGTEHIVDTVTHRPDKELVRWVEDALRNLADISHLGQSPLVAHLGIRGETHLVRGQALRGKILEILEVLRPPGERPPEPLPREWYSYAVLHDAYVEDVPNREIMARLYISEGTFNRTRRKAIRAMARSILELQVVD